METATSDLPRGVHTHIHTQAAHSVHPRVPNRQQRSLHVTPSQAQAAPEHQLGIGFPGSQLKYWLLGPSQRPGLPTVLS